MSMLLMSGISHLMDPACEFFSVFPYHYLNGKFISCYNPRSH